MANLRTEFLKAARRAGLRPVRVGPAPLPPNGRFRAAVKADARPAPPPTKSNGKPHGRATR